MEEKKEPKPEMVGDKNFMQIPIIRRRTTNPDPKIIHGPSYTPKRMQRPNAPDKRSK